MNETNFKLTEQELKQDPESLFTLMDKLGEGSYGSVYKAMHKKTTLITALKIVPIDDDLEDIIKEINVMNGCNSSAIVKYYGSFFKNDHLWMFIEFCPAGSVSDIMKLTRTLMTEPEIAVICRNTLKGLEYLHERRKIHRDIKAGNILLNIKGESKLADFGVAGQLSDTVAKRNTVIGTPFWMAPEIIQEVGYGTEADIWSLGITCIEMAEGKPPYYNIHPMRAIFIIPTRPPPTLETAAKFSADFNKFIALCLTKNPAERPTATDLLKSAFIANAGTTCTLLVEKCSRSAELIAQGELSKRDEEEEDEDEEKEEDDGDSVYASQQKKQQQGTMTKQTIKDGDRISVEEVTEEFGTMIVNDSKNTTMKSVGMNMMNQQDATMKPLKASKQQQQQPEQTRQPQLGDKSDSITELNEMLKAIEDSMDREIKTIKHKYDQKRKPILEALHAKGASGQGPGI